MSDVNVIFEEPAPIVVQIGPTVVKNTGGGAGMEYVQSSPLATWVITHGFGRRPNVSIYIAGELVDTDVVATSTQATITFPSPMSGTAVLT